MEYRPKELEKISQVVDFLVVNYPEYFGKSEYTHPVKGECKTLIFKTRENKTIDYSSITDVNINFVLNTISVHSTVKNEWITIYNFIKDETVM
jgi:hypothetical protein